jgi:hypothetical protein
MFLRWLGGRELTKAVKCLVNFISGVLNKKELARSIESIDAGIWRIKTTGLRNRAVGSVGEN